jgi:type II secretory pathway pseudopilin PulG
MRRFTPVELAIGVALVGSILAVAVPTFVREVHASRLVEPTDGLARIGANAVAYAEANRRFQDTAPMTPAVPPRGKKEADPPGTWDTPAWKAIDFRPAPDGVPHAYAFAFDAPKPNEAFVARARGDLDGDGLASTFEIRGGIAPADQPKLVPGMYVEAELE